MTDPGAECVDCLFRSLSPALLISKLREPQKIQCRDRTCCRFRAVTVFLHAKQDIWILACPVEITSGRFVKKETILRFLQSNGKLKQIYVKAGFIKIKQPLNNKGVVIR